MKKVLGILALLMLIGVLGATTVSAGGKCVLLPSSALNMQGDTNNQADMHFCHLNVVEGLLPCCQECANYLTGIDVIVGKFSKFVPQYCGEEEEFSSFIAVNDNFLVKSGINAESAAIKCVTTNSGKPTEFKGNHVFCNVKTEGCLPDDIPGNDGCCNVCPNYGAQKIIGVCAQECAAQIGFESWTTKGKTLTAPGLTSTIGIYSYPDETPDKVALCIENSLGQGTCAPAAATIVYNMGLGTSDAVETMCNELKDLFPAGTKVLFKQGGNWDYKAVFDTCNICDDYLYCKGNPDNEPIPSITRVGWLDRFLSKIGKAFRGIFSWSSSAN